MVAEGVEQNRTAMEGAVALGTQIVVVRNRAVYRPFHVVHVDFQDRVLTGALRDPRR